MLKNKAILISGPHSITLSTLSLPTTFFSYLYSLSLSLSLSLHHFTLSCSLEPPREYSVQPHQCQHNKSQNKEEAKA
ncbi:hypothetical protein RIF29_26559 [Crotalaria pallida]|uniref:Uncharacterized protein n=1 Tax=Crotalaria pallida TaxID=3830 RepID=A0AAN9EQ44_CROPI